MISPAIGMVIGSLVQPRFEQAGIRGRALWSLAGLYGSAIVFGIAAGVGDVVLRSGAHPMAALGAGILTVLWGVTLTGFFLFLWPLAYGTHRLVEWAANEQGPG